MRQFIDMTIATARNAVAIVAITALTVLAACSKDGNSVTIDARFLNMNQAHFYLYSPDGAIQGIDTVEVQAGRFTYNTQILQEGTLVIIFPNYATIPVFVTPGDDIDIDANAAHLRTMSITGNDDNKLFTEWRKNCDKLSPEQMKKQAEQFIKDHPASAASRWLVNQYFILDTKPDIIKAKKLLTMMLKASDNNIQVSRMLNKINEIGALPVGSTLPRLQAKDINGNAILNGKFVSGNTLIILWASWNYESLSMLRSIASHQNFGNEEKRYDNVVTICLDPDIKECRKNLKNSNAEELTNICDTMMWNSPLIKALGFTNIPDNIRLKNGKVTDRRLPISDLYK
ncbi:MAG: DUF4369 domain-containing protein [Prevotella sp.]|nr:DUF4369 domain-containing protein [Candidatus Prevotella equi]